MASGLCAVGALKSWYRNWYRTRRDKRSQGVILASAAAPNLAQNVAIGDCSALLGMPVLN
jgi:hypothetical protein